MIYKVTAKFLDSKAGEFFQKLKDGSIQNQKPDGPEMVDSMRRAYIQESGLIMWSELCYCNPPLAHERSTVLDNYFTGIVTESIDGYEEYEGDSFWNYLVDKSK
ncbi:MAG: hypothetical protein O7D33_06155 [Chloroflexi bacterium]|nr:hypothetical protein [Chloroflexota bacterium]